MHDESKLADHAAMVAGICWRILGSEADAEDAVQETYLQAFRLARRETIRNPQGLLRRLATTTALSRLRRLRHHADANAADLISREETPPDRLEREELKARLREAIASLPAREAEVFCLRYLENLSHQEIVAVLNVPYHTVTSAIYRAKKRLKAEFADLQVREDR